MKGFVFLLYSLYSLVMVDINNIKNLLHFFPYLKEETWYMLGTGIIIYIIYVCYLVAFERYYKIQKNISTTTPLEKKTPQEILDELSINDEHFFEKISFILRSYLENSHRVPLATKKTPGDITLELNSIECKDILDSCTYYEYAGELWDREKREQIKERAQKIMQELAHS